VFRPTSRPVRRSPLHQQLVDGGAVFGSSADWSYPLWFRSSGDGLVEECAGGGDAVRLNAVRIEHLAARSGVGLFDVSLLSKFLVEGRDAELLLSWLSTNQLDVPVGKVVYTPWCDEDGSITADVTITRVTRTRFLVIGTDTVQRDLAGQLQRGAERLVSDVAITDVTSGSGVISVQGPNARLLLERLTDADLSSIAFGYLRAQTIEVAGVDVYAVRVTFTGDLGWELYVPTEYTAHVYNEMFDAADGLGARPCGIDSMYSMGSEKGYLDYGYSLRPGTTPIEANLRFTIDWKKERGFQGLDALIAQRDAGPPMRRIVLVRTSSVAMVARPGERVLRNGVDVGQVIAMEAGHSVGGGVGYAMVRAVAGVSDEWLTAGAWSLPGDPAEPVVVGTTAWFDPTRSRILV
jgi:glycine cleavage system aminomethyltransferase T